MPSSKAAMQRRGDSDGGGQAMPLRDSRVFAGSFSKEKAPATVHVTLSGDTAGGSAAAIVSGNINARSNARISECACDMVIPPMLLLNCLLLLESGKFSCCCTEKARLRLHQTSVF